MTKAKTVIPDNTWLKASILLAVFVGAYVVPIRAMVSIWWNNGDYSYAFLIPLSAGYLLWDKRKTLHTVPINSSWKILPALILFILFSLYGILGSTGSASITSIPILIMLFAAFCFGVELAKQLIFPLGILVFMVPVPDVVERNLGFYLKSISSKLGGALIGFFDIPVNVRGNIIDLGVTQLQVVDACSGMRYIFALLALGTLYAYFFEKAAWKQIVCIAATIPISILINILRIGMTGILTARYGAGMAEGFFHDFSGWAIFIVAFGFLFLLGRILAFFPPKKYDGKTFDAADNADKALPGGKHGSVNKAFLISALLLLIVGAVSMSTAALPAIHIRGGMEKFPLEFAGWRGQSEVVDPEVVKQSGAEESFSGSYIKSDHSAVSLYMGYRSTAFLSNENFFHSPNVCLPSSGWRTIEESTHVIAGVPSFGEIKVAKMVMDYMGKKSLVYFWFQTKDKTTADKSVNRFHLAMHAIKRDNTHDLFIRPITTLQQGERIEDGEKRLDQFVRDMMAELLLFLKKTQYEKA